MWCRWLLPVGMWRQHAASRARWSAGAWRVLWRDSACTASPNAGRPMAALAGALGVRLEKVGQYVLNPPGVLPDAATIAVARRIAAMAMALGAGVAATLLATRGQDT